MIAFDVETTGRNPDTDQIVELSMCLYEGGREETYYQLFKPDVPIAKGAEAVHGISMADVAAKPRFPAKADEVDLTTREAGGIAQAQLLKRERLDEVADPFARQRQDRPRHAIGFTGQGQIDAGRLQLAGLNAGI